MAFIGQIEGASGSNGIDKDSWIRLIDSHPQLSVVPPQKGINPFTRKPIEFKALPTSAIVCIGGEEIGSISWAQDGSPSLIVEADDKSADAIASLAQELAIDLGGTFTRWTNEA